MPATFLSLRAISRSFGGVRALDDVSFDVHGGEVHCLAGENGSGKSTLIKIVAGVHRPQQGTIQVDGRSFTHLSPVEAVSLGIQVIYQDLSLFPNLTVAENLAINSWLKHGTRLVRWRDVRQLAEHAADRLHVRLDLDALVGNLPVADQQLVAIARALLQDARLVVLDEPTTALTSVEVSALFEVVRQLRDQGVAIVFVSHKLREMRQIGDRVTVLRNGTVVESGPAADFDEARLARAMTGRALAGAAARPPVDPSAAPVLRVANLRGPILRGVGFDLRAGEVLGLTGLLGSGQRDVALTLAGLTTRSSGDIVVDGRVQALWDVRQARRVGVGYVPEDRLGEGLFLDQSIARNTNASSLRQLRSRFGLVSRAKAAAQVARWMRDLRVKLTSAGQSVRTLSGGNQQRVVLARVLATGPRLLILNGPTVGVDVGAKAEIHEIIRSLASQGLGVLMISDDLAELAEHCNRLLIMHHGAIVGELAGDDLTEDHVRERINALAS